AAGGDVDRKPPERATRAVFFRARRLWARRLDLPSAAGPIVLLMGDADAGLCEVLRDLRWCSRRDRGGLSRCRLRAAFTIASASRAAKASRYVAVETSRYMDTCADPIYGGGAANRPGGRVRLG